MRAGTLAVFLCCGAASLSGQAFEVYVNGGQSLLSNAGLGSLSAAGTAPAPGDQTDYSLTDGFRLGFSITLNSSRFFGHEFGYAYNRTTLRLSSAAGTSEQGMAIHQGGYTFLLYATPEGVRVRPFAAGGVQFSNYVPPGASVTSGGGSTKIGFNYGAGIKVRLNSMFALRFDLRQFQNTKPFDLPGRSGLIRQTSATMGFGLVL